MNIRNFCAFLFFFVYARPLGVGMTPELRMIVQNMGKIRTWEKKIPFMAVGWEKNGSSLMMKNCGINFLGPSYLGIHHASLVQGLYMLYSPMTRQDDGNFEGHQEFSTRVLNTMSGWILHTPNGGFVREIPLFQLKPRLVKYYNLNNLARCLAIQLNLTFDSQKVSFLQLFVSSGFGSDNQIQEPTSVEGTPRKRMAPFLRSLPSNIPMLGMVLWVSGNVTPRFATWSSSRNTWASPHWKLPLKWGANHVVESKPKKC